MSRRDAVTSFVCLAALTTRPGAFDSLARPETDQVHVAGMFGPGILKGIKIVFDYPHRRIAFVK